MIISLGKIKKLPIFTESGMALGKIFNINFLTENCQVANYEARAFLGRQIYLISPTQIKSFGPEKIIVEDAVLKERKFSQRENKLSSHELNTAITIDSSHP